MSDESLNLVEEYPGLFFSDGNVVFIAGDSPTIAFCLHRDRVHGWSQTFHELLNNLDAASDPLTFKDHPAIKIEDSALDFGRLVRVMYHGITFMPKKCTVEDFPHLAGILVLSQKYNIADLFNHARVILLAAYPFTLTVWDIREAYEFFPASRRNRIEAVQSHAPPLGVVSLALQLNAPCLLIPAYLDLARLPVSEIISGYITTTPIANAPAHVVLQLNSKQMTSVLRGKETLQRFIAEFIRTELEHHTPATHCRYLNIGMSTEPSPCSKAFAQVTHELLVMVADVVSGVDSDPLFVLQCAMEILKIEGRSQGEGACTACVESFSRVVFMGRQHVWACLEKWFNLHTLIDKGFNEGGWE